MAWTTPATFTTGNVLTAAQLNTNLRDNTNFLHSPPGCLAQRTSAQSISNNTLTIVSFNGTDLYDTDSMHDAVGAPTDIIINTSGVYLISTSIQFAANSTGARWLVIVYNPTIELGGAKDSGPTAGIASALTVSVPYKFTAGAASIQVNVQQTSGGILSITNSSLTTLTGNTPTIQFGAQWVSDGT